MFGWLATDICYFFSILGNNTNNNNEEQSACLLALLCFALLSFACPLSPLFQLQ
jgi:hypothetical protein